MNNHNDKALTPEPADLAMQQVLQAEREAEQAVLRCQREASETLKAAQQQAQHLAARTNERISMLQMRYNQKLNLAINAIEQAGQMTEKKRAGKQTDAIRLRNIIDELTVELTTLSSGISESDQES